MIKLRVKRPSRHPMRRNQEPVSRMKCNACHGSGFSIGTLCPKCFGRGAYFEFCGQGLLSGAITAAAAALVVMGLALAVIPS